MKYGANIINHVDKCIQASNRGPDALPYPYPCTQDLQAPTTMKGRTLQDPVIQTVSTGHSPIFTANSHANRQRQGHRRRSCKRKMKKPTQDCEKKQEVRVMNKKTAWRIKGSIPTSVAVVKNSNGTDLSSHDVSHLPQWLNRNYCVPSPTDMIQRSILQRVYVLSPDKLSQLLKMKPVHIDCADDMVLSFSDDIFSTVCVDNSPISDATESNHVFSHIFIGADTPDTSVMTSYTLTDVGVIVFAGPMKYVDIKEYHPVSVSLVDPLFHHV